MKIGLEIHQRLLTHKLFCACPSELSEDVEGDLVVRRQLRPVVSELGEIDVATKYEFEKRKQFEYIVFEKNNCLVELDEEPPHPMNKEALEIALEIAMHLNAKVLDEIYVMRKIVIDGSNTCGFQRTCIIALDGYIDTSRGKVCIPTIALEEESAGIVRSDSSSVTYRLDRLGIPLIEISTAPDIVDGAHLLEVAEKIGLTMRATGRVARGIGSIRQDINVSVEGGARVEIKGAQELKLLPLLAEGEIKRQRALLEILAELRTRVNRPFSAERKFVDLTDILKNTSSELIRQGISRGQRVIGLKLEHHRGLVGKEIQPGKRYGTELSEYAKTAGVKGIIHSDEQMEKYGLTPQEIEGVRSALEMAENDAFVLVVAESERAKRALDKVCERASMDYIPSETRRANPDGTTSFIRPMPGSARLYPETDIPSIRITKELLSGVRKGESYEDKKKKFERMLSPEMAERIVRSRNMLLFEKLVEEFPGVEPTIIANTIENVLVSLRREGFVFENVQRTLEALFAYYSKGMFVKSAIPEILKLVARGRSVEQAVSEGGLRKITGKELESIVKENNFDIKKIMARYRLVVEAEEVQKIIKARCRE
ncbi:MAG: Glu-tRNA(Gln) amidotransferase subunit GatE [Candidatus Bilamarchaeaceae archaeon]